MPTNFTAQTDRHLVRAGNRSRRFVLVKVTAPKRRPGMKLPKRPPVNVAFVLDRSGSMAGPKIGLAKYAVERALQGLSPRDRFSVVTYDEQIETVVSSRLATAKAKQETLLRLQTVDSRGSTDLHGGWVAGAQQIREHLAPEGVNRCLVLTDGQANVGVVDPAQLTAVAADLRASGIATSTFGVGTDFNEELLTAMADAGGGHFYFIDRPEQIVDVMTSELGELLDTVAREVVVDIKHAVQVEIEPLSPVVAGVGAPAEVRLLLGDMVAGQDVELVLALRFPEAAVGAATTAFFTVSDRDSVLKADGCSVEWTYADHAANDAQPRNPEVDRAVARLYAARARQEAVHLNRIGEFSAARQAVRGVVNRIKDYAGSDPQIAEVATSLEADVAAFEAPMREMDRKLAHFSSANIQRSRDSHGQARR